MIIYDKSEIRKQLEIENIYDLLQEWGGEPEYTDFGILSTTICHNLPGEGSKKLYYYKNSGLFKCYTGCDASFDIFELLSKVMDVQFNKQFDLNQSVMWIVHKYNLSGQQAEDTDNTDLDDWKYLTNYERLKDVGSNVNILELKEYNPDILSRFNYSVKLAPWLNEGISQLALDNALIGFYPGGDQITIPHFDQTGRFIGLRGRTLCEKEGEVYGKYRPIKVNQTQYNHPLGMNLYNLNNSRKNIQLMKKAIVFEAEKSCLKYQSYFGIENDISVACCGSSITAQQMQLLLDAGAQEIIIAFDRQFKEIGDDEFLKLKKSLLKIRDKYKNYVTISFIFDKKRITGYKASPIDEGKDKFLQLFKERIIL